jgi:hypothetical protein
MARPLRIQYPGAVYHAMARGNQGQPVFRDDQDRGRFLQTLGEACEKTGWRIHAYVIQGNESCHFSRTDAFAHVMNRGDRREATFQDDEPYGFGAPAALASAGL